jgi:hypothetical protein
MEYTTSVKTQLRTFVLCKDCKLWFLSDSNHRCTGNDDNTVHNYNIKWDIT